jgi:hypothetical protein
VPGKIKLFVHDGPPANGQNPKAFEYLTGVALFKLHESSSVSLGDVHLQRIIEHIGPLPPSFLQACPRATEFFDEKGASRSLNPSVNTT